MGAALDRSLMTAFRHQLDSLVPNRMGSFSTEFSFVVYGLRHHRPVISKRGLEAKESVAVQGSGFESPAFFFSF